MYICLYWTVHNFGQFMKHCAARNLVLCKTQCSVILILACSLRLACPRVSTLVKTEDKQSQSEQFTWKHYNRTLYPKVWGCILVFDYPKVMSLVDGMHRRMNVSLDPYNKQYTTSTYWVDKELHPKIFFQGMQWCSASTASTTSLELWATLPRFSQGYSDTSLQHQASKDIFHHISMYFRSRLHSNFQQFPASTWHVRPEPQHWREQHVPGDRWLTAVDSRW